MKLQTISDVIYLVDLENIGVKPFCKHTKMCPNEEYIVFYSENTSDPGSILEQVDASLHITFIDCKTGSNNAMDFCICAMAGKLSSTHGKTIKILSDDKGYDSMLHMLQQQGIRIKRETVASKPSSKIVETNCESKEDISIITAIKLHVPARYQNDLMSTLPNAINREEAHNMIQAVLPNTMASDIYKKLKDYIPKKAV